MQIHCTFCHRPLNIPKREAEAALALIHREGLDFYELRCPHCRKMNKLPPEILRRAAPQWQPEPEA